jgi:hypothetical protein
LLYAPHKKRDGRLVFQVQLEGLSYTHGFFLVDEQFPGVRVDVPTRSAYPKHSVIASAEIG